MATLTEKCERTHDARDCQTRKQPRYHVIMLDDDDHTYDYVIELLQKLFCLSRVDAYRKAVEVDTASQAIVDTTTKERAEFKRDQIHAYGSDWRIDSCCGSMSAMIEPALD